MSKIFRAKYVAILRSKGIKDKKLMDELFTKNWVVYAKRPVSANRFGDTNRIIEYLGRYTHKVAISNHRIQEVTKTQVSFSYKDYKDGGKTKIMTLSNEEFIRRFAQHILPHRFVRIRPGGEPHYGFLSGSWKAKKLKDLQQKLKVIVKAVEPKVILNLCLNCKTPTMVTIEIFHKRGPPRKYDLWAKTINPA